MRTIVGREGELDAIRSFLTGGDARSKVLLLEGVAGIGKTTLWEAATAAAGDIGFRVLSARPLEVETRISFAAAGDLLAGVLDEVASELPDPQRRALEVALALRDADGVPPAPEAIAFAFLKALRLLARRGPRWSRSTTSSGSTSRQRPSWPTPRADWATSRSGSCSRDAAATEVRWIGGSTAPGSRSSPSRR